MNPQSFVALGKWISVLSRYGQMYVTRHLRQFGVGPGQLPYLMHLYDQDGVSLDHLSKLVVVDKATSTRAVMSLEEAGLVTRVTDEEDRRVKRVFLTEKAHAIRPDIRKTLRVWAEVLTKNLTEEEAIQLVTLLEKVAEGAVDYLDHPDTKEAD
jgi:DNA-binding MarR family transcriptional regulator